MVNSDRQHPIIHDYRDLTVWKDSMALAVDIYRITKLFPDDERYGMTSQMRRCASSIPANIAEGFGRESRQSFIQFLRIAQGSLKELETHGELAHRVGLMDENGRRLVSSKCTAIGKMLRSLIRKLAQKGE